MLNALVLPILVGLLLVCGSLAYWAWRELGEVEGQVGGLGVGPGGLGLFAPGADAGARRERGHRSGQADAGPGVRRVVRHGAPYPGCVRGVSRVASVR